MRAGEVTCPETMEKTKASWMEAPQRQRHHKWQPTVALRGRGALGIAEHWRGHTSAVTSSSSFFEGQMQPNVPVSQPAKSGWNQDLRLKSLNLETVITKFNFFLNTVYGKRIRTDGEPLACDVCFGPILPIVILNSSTVLVSFCLLPRD